MFSNRGSISPTIEARLLSLDHDSSQAGSDLTRMADIETIHSLFRSFHTIKGLAGFMELADIKDVAHEVETLLDDARNGRMSISREVVDVVLSSTDYLSRWMQELDNDPLAPAPVERSCTDGLIVRIRAMVGSDAPVSQSKADVQETAAVEEPVRTLNRSRAAKMVKVDTEKLGFLVDMVGELVIAQSLVRHDPDLAQIQQSQLTRNLRQLARITEEVQRTAMSIVWCRSGRFSKRWRGWRAI